MHKFWYIIYKYLIKYIIERIIVVDNFEKIHFMIYRLDKLIKSFKLNKNVKGNPS